MSSDAPTHDVIQEPHLRLGSESWVIAAFLALFSVAIASALPQISVAVRSAVDGKTANGTVAKDRNAVRVRATFVRQFTAKAAGAPAAFVASSPQVVAPVSSARATALSVD